MYTVAESRYKREVIRIVEVESSARVVQTRGESIKAVCRSVDSSSRLGEIRQRA